MEKHTPFREEVMKLHILHKRHHEQQKPDRKQKQARKRMRRSNQELIMGRRPQDLTGKAFATAKLENLFAVEYHKRPKS